MPTTSIASKPYQTQIISVPSSSSHEQTQEVAKKLKKETREFLNKFSDRPSDSEISLSLISNDQSNDSRINAQGYDLDHPMQAIEKYMEEHPTSTWQKIKNSLVKFIYDLPLLGAPSILSASAGSKKFRIHPDFVLQITRESLEQFPEINCTIPSEEFSHWSASQKNEFWKHKATIREAQHDFIISRLSKAYPGHIDTNPKTILYTGGRASGYLKILHVSVDQYVALYYSDWGITATDSGSYERSHVFDFILEGCNVNWEARHMGQGHAIREETYAGDYTYLGPGDRKIWSYEGPCAMIDMGCGHIPSMLPIAVASNMTSTLNTHALSDILGVQASGVIHEYAQRFKEMVGVDISADVQEPNHVREEDLEAARAYFFDLQV